MKKIILVMISIFFITAKIVARPQAIRTKNGDVQKAEDVVKKKCNNLICLFDPFQQESVFGDNHAMAYDLMDALQDKVAPIIVTTNTVEHFCYWKTHIIPEAPYHRFETAQKLKLRALGTHLNEWECYFHKRSGLVLLIPQKYLATHATTYGSQGVDPIVQCGFDIENLEKIKDVSCSTILEYIQNHTPTYDSIIDDFKSMFIKKRNQASPVSVWNIYLSGHGGPGIVHVKKANERIILKSIKQVKLRIQQIKQRSSYGYEIKLELAENELRKLLQQLKQVRSYGVSWEQNTLTVGLYYKDFIRLMEFFEEGINVSYVHYSTCFAGGFNQTLLNLELASLNVSFIVSTQGINESITYGGFFVGQFAEFFTKLEILICESSALVKDQESMAVLIKNSLPDILNSATIGRLLDYTQPFVRIPSIGVFKAIDMVQSVKLLTHSLLKAHEATGSSIDYTDSSIKTIFMYPSHITVPLKIADHVAIVSPAPQTLMALQKPTIHIIDKMFYQDTLSSILPNFVSFNTRFEPIIFIIKELHCLDGYHLSVGAGENKSIVIKDMIIKITNYYSSFAVLVDVMFNYNDNDYAISKKIIKSKESEKKIFDAFEEGKFDLLTNENFEKLALDIEDGIAMLKNKNKKISLSSMIEYFEEQIDDQKDTKKISVSKYVILLKKIKKIQLLTTPEVLAIQKSLIVKTDKSPGLSWMYHLKRLKKSAQAFLESINQLLASSNDREKLLSLKKKIESTLEMLNKEYIQTKSQLSLQEKISIKIQPLKNLVERIEDIVVGGLENVYSYIIEGKSKKYRYGYGRVR